MGEEKKETFAEAERQPRGARHDQAGLRALPFARRLGLYGRDVLFRGDQGPSADEGQ